MRKGDISALEDLSKDIQEFFDVLNSESDLAVALIAASYLDASLAGMLTRRLRKSSVTKQLLNPTGGALGTLSARADAAYSLELIDKALYQDLRRVAEIRNRFAHHHLAKSFADPDVGSLVNELGYLDILRDSRSGKPLTVLEYAKDARSRFVLDVVLISQKLLVSGLAIGMRAPAK